MRLHKEILLFGPLILLLMPSLVAAPFGRDVSVEIGPIVKSQTATPGQTGNVPVPQNFPVDVWSVDVSIFDRPAELKLPRVEFDAYLNVLSAGKGICKATKHLAMSPNGGWYRALRFQITYPREQTRSPQRLPKGHPSAQTAPPLQAAVPYTIQASANINDSNPSNNQKSVTLNFPPGGTPECQPL
jgi:hypothetical protein